MVAAQLADTALKLNIKIRTFAEEEKSRDPGSEEPLLLQAVC